MNENLTRPSPLPLRWVILTWSAVAVGAALRFIHIGAQSLWFDEGYTAWMVTHPPREILRLIEVDTAPPLYYLMLRVWTDIFGYSEAALRSMSAIFSVGTLILVVLIARRFLAHPATLAAAAWISCFSFLQIQYAQEARAYALMGFLIVAAFYCLLKHRESQHPGWLLAFAIFVTAAMYTHNTAIPYVLGLGLAWLCMKPRWKDVAVVANIIVVLYLPWIFVLPAQVGRIHEGFWLSRPNVTDFVRAFKGITGLPLLLGIPLAVYAFARLKGREAGVLWVALVPPVLIGAYSLIATPLFMDKLFLASAALSPILLLMPFGNVKLACSAGVLAAILSAYALHGFEQTDRKEDWRAAAAFVQQLPPQPRLILFDANDGQLPFDHYYHYRPNETAFGVPMGFLAVDPPVTMRRVQTPEDLDAVEKTFLPNFDQVVLVVSTGHLPWCDPKGLTLAMLRERYPEEDVTQFWGVSVYRFRRQ